MLRERCYGYPFTYHSSPTPRRSSKDPYIGLALLWCQVSILAPGLTRDVVGDNPVPTKLLSPAVSLPRERKRPLLCQSVVRGPQCKRSLTINAEQVATTQFPPQHDPCALCILEGHGERYALSGPSPMMSKNPQTGKS